jgi:uncharacterized protein
MTEPSLDAPDHADLAQVLSRVGYTEPAAHFHGLLCGALCVLPVERLAMDALLDDSGTPVHLDAEDRAALQRLRDTTLADLLSTDMGFEPLLPDDSAGLGARTEALAAWCGGFLVGLSSFRKLDLKSMSEEARETLRDFTEFTQAGSEAGEDAEAEEGAYAELVEYVRVGAQLLFLELRPRPPAVDDESSTVH